MRATKLKDFIKFALKFKSKKYLKFPKPNLNFYNFSTMAEQGKRTKETTGESIPEHKESQKIGGVFKKSPNPQYIDERIKIYDSLMKQQKLAFESVNRRAIQITLKDGKQLEGKCFETTPIDIARKISKKLAENVIVAKVTYSKKELSPLDSGIFYGSF